MNLLAETLILKLIYLIMQQKQILKNATGIDTSKLETKSDLVGLKALVYKLDIDKLLPVPVDLNLSDVVKNDVVKKNVFDKLVAKVNDINICGFVLKTKYETSKSDLENKFSDADKSHPDTYRFVKNRLKC